VEFPINSLIRKAGLLLILFCLAISPAFAGCHCVTPSGSGSMSGADWNNAYAGLPTTLVRGDIYYLADGTYAPNLTFSEPDSGSLTLEIRKAQPGDHCTNTGWNTSTMGSAQAVLPRQIMLSTDYVTINGNGSQATPGCGGAPGSLVTSAPPSPADCGIKLDGSGCSGGANACNAVMWATQAVSYITVEYVELEGNGDNNSDQFEYFNPYGGTTYTWTHVYGHNAGCVYLQDGLDGLNMSYSYFWGTEINMDGGSCHGQFMFDSGADSNGVMANNVFRDITGTAIWTFANTSTTHNNWLFYNNAIWDSSPVASWSPFLSDGVIACINTGTNCTNFVFVQNTIVGMTSNSTSGINNENTGSYTVENNLWYDIAWSGGVTFNTGTGGTYTQDHNSFLNLVTTCPTGTSNVCVGSAPNPFVNWTSGNLNLAAENADWNNRLALSSPFTTDVNGNPFTSDRGAYQVVQAVDPPTNVSAKAY